MNSHSRQSRTSNCQLHMSCVVMSDIDFVTKIFNIMILSNSELPILILTNTDTYGFGINT